MIKKVSLMKTLICYFTVMILLNLAWIGLEYIVDGQVMPSCSDKIVGVWFAYFITHRLACCTDWMEVKPK